jgi:hypothetical protein
MKLSDRRDIELRFDFPHSAPHQSTAAFRLRSLDHRKQANPASTHQHGVLLSDDTPHPQVADRAIKFGGTAISPPPFWCQPPMVGARRRSAMSGRDCSQQTSDSGFEARLILLKRPDRTETIRKTKHGGELGQSASAHILEAKLEVQRLSPVRASDDAGHPGDAGRGGFLDLHHTASGIPRKVIEPGRTNLGDTNLILLSRR